MELIPYEMAFEKLPQDKTMDSYARDARLRRRSLRLRRAGSLLGRTVVEKG